MFDDHLQKIYTYVWKVGKSCLMVLRAEFGERIQKPLVSHHELGIL